MRSRPAGMGGIAIAPSAYDLNVGSGRGRGLELRPPSAVHQYWDLGCAEVDE